MSDMSSPETLQEEAVASPQQQSAGALLRTAREAAGLHVAALAVSMKVPVKKLEALESDRLDLLPDAVFVRALASSVCRTLKIDAGPVLALLPQNNIPRLDSAERGINAPFHVHGETRGMVFPAALRQPVAIAVVLLLFAALVVAFLPEFHQLDPSSAEGEMKPGLAAPAEEPLVVATPSVAPASGEVAATPAVTPVLAQAPAVPSAIAASNAAALVLPPSVPPAPTGAEKVPLAMPVANPSDTVVFKVRGPSWVEVTDGKGSVQLRRTLVAGDTASASGASPLTVVVGRADVTDVEVRGKSFSVMAIAKDNVARFEVK
jgi:cytoskeleton protein RodZ